MVYNIYFSTLVLCNIKIVNILIITYIGRNFFVSTDDNHFYLIMSRLPMMKLKQKHNTFI